MIMSKNSEGAFNDDGYKMVFGRRGTDIKFKDIYVFHKEDTYYLKSI